MQSKTKLKKKSKSKKRKHRKKTIKDALWEKKQTLIEKYLTKKKYGDMNVMALDMRNPRNLSIIEYGIERSLRAQDNLYNDYSINNQMLHKSTSANSYVTPIKPDFDNNILASDPFDRLRNKSSHINTISHPTLDPMTGFSTNMNLNPSKSPLVSFKQKGKHK